MRNVFSLLALGLLLLGPSRAQAQVDWRPNGMVQASAYVGSTLYVGGAFTRLEAQTGGAVVFGAFENTVAAVHAAPFAEVAQRYNAATRVGEQLAVLGGAEGLSIVQFRPQTVPFTVGSATTLPSGYRECAQERTGSICQYEGTVILYYGTPGNYKFGPVTGPFACINGNELFGDPVRMQTKACFIPEVITHNPPELEVETVQHASLTLPGAVHALHTTSTHVLVGGEGFVCRIPRAELVNGTPNRCAPLATVSGTVHALHQSGTHLYIGGLFTGLTVGAEQSTQANLARLNGTALDAEWRPDVNNAVHALVSHDGRLIAGGAFTRLGSPARNRLAAFDLESGNVASWTPNVTTGTVFTLALDESHLYVGGTFTRLAGQPRNGIARFNASSLSIDLGWSVGLASTATTVFSVLPRGEEVILGGAFQVQANGQEHRNLVAVSSQTGAFQPWRPNPNGEVRNLLAGFSGTSYVMASGGFTAGSGLDQPHLAAFTVGDVYIPVEAFRPLVNAPVRALVACEEGLYAGGDFTQVNGMVRERLAGFDAATGALRSWSQTVNANVHTLGCSSGVLYAGGEFATVDGVARTRLASFDLKAGGRLTGWAPAANGTVSALSVVGNTVYVGGQFTQVGGIQRNRLASVGAQSGVVSLWNPNVNGPVHTLAADARFVYVGGDFTQVGTTTRNSLAQVDPVGQVTPWNPSVNGAVRSLLMDNGVLYAGGDFTTVAGAPQTGLAAFATRGTLSAPVQAAEGNVRTLSLGNGQLLAGGSFTGALMQRERLSDSRSAPSERVYLQVREGAQTTAMEVAFDRNSTHHTTGQNLPPTPPPGIFDVRFMTSATTASHTWIAVRDSFRLQVQRTVATNPVQIGFALPENALGILRASTGVVATLSGRDIVELNLPGTLWTLDLSLVMGEEKLMQPYTLEENEWTLVSFALLPDEGNRVEDIFPPKTDVFGFDNGYVIVEEIEPMRGYWVNAPNGADLLVMGAPPSVQEVRVREGWNIISGFSIPVARTALNPRPATLLPVSTSIFEYVRGEGYRVATQLQPGRAYWLRAAASGVIRPGVASFAPALRVQEPELLPLVRVTDASGRSGQVYRAPDAATVQNYLLPPLPPPPSFDLRLANGSLATTFSAGEAQVLVQGGTYPLRVEAVPGAPYMEVVSANGTVLGFLGERPVVVTEPGGFTLRAAVPEVPEALEVRALYPQPASREVTLQIGLPEAGFATVTVFNLIGQEVMRVELAEREAGFARETLRVDDLPAGMYVLRIHTDRESQTRSLVIAR